MPEIIVGDWKLIMHVRYTYALNIRGSVNINHTSEFMDFGEGPLDLELSLLQSKPKTLL